MFYFCCSSFSLGTIFLQSEEFLLALLIVQAFRKVIHFIFLYVKIFYYVLLIEEYLHLMQHYGLMEFLPPKSSTLKTLLVYSVILSFDRKYRIIEFFNVCFSVKVFSSFSLILALKTISSYCFLYYVY
jgi:hypothetical protein